MYSSDKLSKDLDLSGDFEATAYVPPVLSASSIRDWWHDILRNYGRNSFYGIFLLLPSDVEVIRYLVEFENELDMITRNDCLILIFTRIGFRRQKIDRVLSQIAVEDHVIDGHCIQLGDMFNVDIQEYPCLLLFNSIRSPQFIIVSLKRLMAAEISEKMRMIFSVSRNAIAQGKNPLDALEAQRHQQTLLNISKVIIKKTKSVTGKTLDVAMKAWIESMFK